MPPQSHHDPNTPVQTPLTRPRSFRDEQLRLGGNLAVTLVTDLASLRPGRKLAPDGNTPARSGYKKYFGRLLFLHFSFLHFSASGKPSDPGGRLVSCAKYFL